MCSSTLVAPRARTRGAADQSIVPVSRMVQVDELQAQSRSISTMPNVDGPCGHLIWRSIKTVTRLRLMTQKFCQRRFIVSALMPFLFGQLQIYRHLYARIFTIW
jgi:hypothetical protein